MSDFYVDVLNRLQKKNILHRDMRILVLCGGKYDWEALQKAGLTQVTIANLDVRMKGHEYAPFAWSFQDAERLTYADNEFDFCIVHNGLHHCFSPHKALLELYRVGKTGLLVFEPRDSAFARLGVRLNFGQDYEVAAVSDNDCAYGGVRNTEIPNYVFRWTEREIEKTVNCFAPYAHNRFLFFYRLRLAWPRFKMMRNKLWLVLAVLAYPFLKGSTVLFPKLCNGFGFVVLKPSLPADLHPWVQMQEGAFKVNKDWVRARYQ